MLMAAEKVENGPHDRRKEGEANGVSPSLRRRPGVEIPCPAVVGVGNKANTAGRLVASSAALPAPECVTVDIELRRRFKAQLSFENLRL